MNSLDINDHDEILTLVSTDNQVFEINVEDLKICDFLIKMHELDSDKKVININTSGIFLKNIVEFLQFYKTNPYNTIQKPIPKNFNNCTFIWNKTNETFQQPFYTKLLDNFKTTNDIIPFLHIVNYLGINPLLELVCAKMANIIRDIPIEHK